jgi:hypothetical protein
MRSVLRGAVGPLGPLFAAVDVDGEAAFAAGMDRGCFVPGPAAEAGFLEVEHGLADLAGVVHDERALLSDGLADGFALKHQDFRGSRAVHKFDWRGGVDFDAA